MKDGFRVYDSDTHVNPAAEVIERYVDPGFRPRLAELAAYRFPVGQGAVGGVAEFHNYRVGTKYYRRVLGERGIKVQAKRLDCSFRIGLKFRIQLSCQGRCSARARKLLGCCNRALLGRCGSDRRNELALPLVAAMLPQRRF